MPNYGRGCQSKYPAEPNRRRPFWSKQLAIITATAARPASHCCCLQPVTINTSSLYPSHLPPPIFHFHHHLLIQNDNTLVISSDALSTIIHQLVLPPTPYPPSLYTCPAARALLPSLPYWATRHMGPPPIFRGHIIASRVRRVPSASLKL